MPWKNCDSHSNIECLRRGCPHARFLYLIDEGVPEVECTKPSNAWQKTVEDTPNSKSLML